MFQGFGETFDTLIALVLSSMGNTDSALGSSGAVATSIFDFEVEGIDDKVVALSQFKGKKAYLVVNVARM